MMKRTKVALVAGTAALALAGIGGGVAFATGDSGSAIPATAVATAASVSPSAAPTSGTAATGKAKAKRLRTLLARTEHGEVTVRTKKGDQVIDVQRGQVTAASTTSVTVKSKDGFTTTYAVTSGSKVRKQKKASAIGDVHTGDRVVVVALHSGNAHTVRRLADAGAPK
jgi:hypothetical protein